MAAWWRKYAHGYRALGWKVYKIQDLLGWSPQDFAREVHLNPGTALKFKEGKDPLNPDKRLVVVTTLAKGLQEPRRLLMHRRDLFDDLARLGGVAVLLRVLPRTNETSAEEEAEVLNGMEAWADARSLWRLAASDAKKQGDKPRWERCTIAASQMSLNLGRLGHAERGFRRILSDAEIQPAPEALAEANVRLGRLYYEQGRLAEARTVLEEGRRLARESRNTRGEFRVLDNGTTVVCDGHEAMDIFATFALDYLGRIDVAAGYPERGLNRLEAACQYARSKHDAWSVGYRLVEKVPGLLRTDSYDRKQMERLLYDSSDFLCAGRYGDGLLNMARARWRQVRNAKGTMDALEAAHDGFTRDTFAPLGLADVYLMMSALLSAAQSTRQQALEYALAALAFRPSRRGSGALARAASGVFADHAFEAAELKRIWLELEASLWDMGRAPFNDLHRLYGFMPDELVHEQLKRALELARGRVARELSVPLDLLRN